MMRVVLVDDEERALLNLELQLHEYCDDVKVVAKCFNALSAVKAITELNPDAVFLDVNMPGYNGFDVLDQVNDGSRLIVFTTAHRGHAINAIRKGAFDLLLKPIDVDELKECVSRIKAWLTAQSGNAGGVIGLSVKDGIFFVRQSEIVRLEAAGSYTAFYLEGDVRHLVSKSMKEYEALLDREQFFRCHNSHIINLRRVTRYINSNGYFAVLDSGAVIEIARKNKETFLERLKKLNV